MWLEVCKYVLFKWWRHSASTYDTMYTFQVTASAGVTQEVHVYFLSDGVALQKAKNKSAGVT